MFKTKKVQYAILFLAYLARNEGKGTVPKAAEHLGISVHFLEQIARKLRIGGLVTSSRGPGGGYTAANHACVGDILFALNEGYITSLEDSRPTAEAAVLAMFTLRFEDALHPLMGLSIGEFIQRHFPELSNA